MALSRTLVVGVASSSVTSAAPAGDGAHADNDDERTTLDTKAVALQWLEDEQDTLPPDKQIAAEAALVEEQHGSSPLSRCMPAPTPHDARYRADIDGLRAVAVLAVVVFHLDKHWLPGGFTGVDIFFVMSGYVVSSSIMTRQASSVSTLLVGFYARRVKRLSPALVVTVMCASCFLTVLLNPHTRGLTDFYYTAQLAIVGVANNKFLIEDSGYFAEGAGALEFNPFTHAWSLGVEEQFYVCKSDSRTQRRSRAWLFERHVRVTL